MNLGQQCQIVDRLSPDYPKALLNLGAEKLFINLWRAGPVELLNHPAVGFFLLIAMPRFRSPQDFGRHHENARRGTGPNWRLSLCYGMGVPSNPAPWPPTRNLDSGTKHRRNALEA
jgi:hypothetical protein